MAAKLTAYGSALVVLGYVLMPIYDGLRPWREAEARIAELSTAPHFMVGFGISHRTDYTNDQRFDTRSRSYLLLPSKGASSTVVAVTDTNGQINTSSAPMSVVFHCLWFAMALAIAIRQFSSPRGTTSTPGKTFVESRGRDGLRRLLRGPRSAGLSRWLLVSILVASVVALALAENPYWWLASLVVALLTVVSLVPSRDS